MVYRFRFLSCITRNEDFVPEYCIYLTLIQCDLQCVINTYIYTKATQVIYTTDARASLWNLCIKKLTLMEVLRIRDPPLSFSFVMTIFGGSIPQSVLYRFLSVMMHSLVLTFFLPSEPSPRKVEGIWQPHTDVSGSCVYSYSKYIPTFIKTIPVIFTGSIGCEWEWLSPGIC